MTSSEGRQDKLVHLIGIASAIIAIITLLVAVAAIPILIDSSDTSANSASSARSAKIISCLKSFEVEKLSGPTAEALRAFATVGPDSPEFREAIGHSDLDGFQTLADMSRRDPDMFLARCEQFDEPP